MRTREEIRAKYYKDCSIKEGWLVTTDEEYLLEEIFEAQTQAKHNEALDPVIEPLPIEQSVFNKRFPNEDFDWDSYYEWVAENEGEAYKIVIEILNAR